VAEFGVGDRGLSALAGACSAGQPSPAEPTSGALGSDQSRLGLAAATLVKGSEEAAAGPDLLGLGNVHPSLFWHQPYGLAPRG